MANLNATLEDQLRESGQLIVSQAQALAIGSQEEYETAGKMLVEIKTRVKQVKDYWSGPKAEAQSVHRTLCDREKTMLKPFTDAEASIKASMVKYQQAVERARILEAEEAKRRQQEEAERLLAESIKAEEKGDDVGATINMAMAQMVEDMTPAPTIETPTAQGTSIRKTWVAKVVDPKAVPSYVNGMEIRTINMTALNQLARISDGTLEIPGVEFELKASIVART